MCVCVCYIVMLCRHCVLLLLRVTLCEMDADCVGGICICTHARTHSLTLTHTHSHAHMHMHMHIHDTFIWAQVSGAAYAYVHTHSLTHTHAHIYMYIHIYMDAGLGGGPARRVNQAQILKSPLYMPLCSPFARALTFQNVS